MKVLERTKGRGVVETRFDLDAGGETVPGLRWDPDPAPGPRPTVLIGHGGTAHKRAPYVLALARRLVRHLGCTAIALDAPEHGDRITDPAAAEAQRAALERRIAAGGGRRMTADDLEARREAMRQAIGEWQALLDDLQASDDELAGGPFGYWGVSMGTLIGVPFVAREPRVTAAVFGLAGGMERHAAKVTVPVLFLFQWDDELMSREAGLALFDAFGSKEKTMHVNPGGHVAMPGFEMAASEEFFARHLTSAGRTDDPGAGR